MNRTNPYLPAHLSHALVSLTIMRFAPFCSIFPENDVQRTISPTMSTLIRPIGPWSVSDYSIGRSPFNPHTFVLESRRLPNFSASVTVGTSGDGDWD